MKNNHHKLYNKVEYYRIAFSYRNIKDECDFIENVYKKYCGKEFHSCIELAAGPSDHSFLFAKREKQVSILDLSEDMTNYVEEKRRELGYDITTYCKDMANFKIQNKKFDLAFMMLDSFPYLLTDEDISHHFNSVADILEDGGIYIIEMDHPGSVLENNYPENKNSKKGIYWEISNDKYDIKMNWGAEGTNMDSATQIANVYTVIEIINKDDGKYIIVKDCAKQRKFLANEFKLYVKLSKRFIIIAQFRSFDAEKIFNNYPDGHRMISILRKER